MKKAIGIILLSSTLLTGCGFFGELKKPEIPPIIVDAKVVVDPKLLQPCQLLPSVEGDQTFESIAEHHLYVIELYGVCALKQDNSIKAIRKLSETK